MPWQAFGGSGFRVWGLGFGVYRVSGLGREFIGFAV